jgi:Domain of unknown function (DUF4338)
MRYCGRQFTDLEMGLICQLLVERPQLTRADLSRVVCEQLSWRRPDGRLKEMSCRVAMLRMEKDGRIKLPPARRAKPTAYRLTAQVEWATQAPESVPAVDLRTLTVDVVGKRDSPLWNGYVHRYHYLGHQLIPGAQLRYFVRAAGQIVALLSFGASAWKTKPRDDLIGWSAVQRVKNLHLIVNNSRFLILPWVQQKNLASRILSLVSRRLPNDWHAAYSFRPVLLETFVEKPRFTGTCYKAANWQCLGDTQGRGKLDQFMLRDKPVKSIWVYPLDGNFRRLLCDS